MNADTGLHGTARRNGALNRPGQGGIMSGVGPQKGRLTNQESHP